MYPLEDHCISELHQQEHSTANPWDPLLIGDAWRMPVHRHLQWATQEELMGFFCFAAYPYAESNTLSQSGPSCLSQLPLATQNPGHIHRQEASHTSRGSKSSMRGQPPSTMPETFVVYASLC